MSGDKDKLEEFGRLEQEKSENPNETPAIVNDAEKDNVNESVYENNSGKKEFKIIDGYRILERHELPFGGAFYPAQWEFAYRCPTSLEVANFSTINNEDQAKIIAGIEELIRACFIIVDRNKQKQVSSHQINDGERLFFFLKLREYYLHDLPITYSVLSQAKEEPVEVKFVAASLIFEEPKQALLDKFDGRMFNIPVPGSSEVIQFLMPTLETAGRIFKYMLKTYQDSQKDNEKMTKESEAFNKKFLLLAPYLFVEGNESIQVLKNKYKNIIKDDVIFKAYIEIINKLNLTNKNTIMYEYDGSEEEALIQFPGGWKAMFSDKGAFSDLF